MPTNRLRKIQRILIILSSVQISWECVKNVRKVNHQKDETALCGPYFRIYVMQQTDQETRYGSDVQTSQESLQIFQKDIAFRSGDFTFLA